MSKTYTWRKALQALREEPKEESTETVTGRCKCGGGAFRHRMENRELIRICSECGDRKIF